MGALCNGGAPTLAFERLLRNEPWQLHRCSRGLSSVLTRGPFVCSFVCLFAQAITSRYERYTPAFRGKMRARYSNRFINAHKYSGTTRTSNRMPIVPGFYSKITFSFSSSHLFHLCSFCRITLQNISPALVSSSRRCSLLSPYLALSIVSRPLFLQKTHRPIHFY